MQGKEKCRVSGMFRAPFMLYVDIAYCWFENAIDVCRSTMVDYSVAINPASTVYVHNCTILHVQAIALSASLPFLK